MGAEPRMSSQTLRALGVLLGHREAELSGAEVGRLAKLQSGTLYPILLRLEGAGWLESRWEEGDPQTLGRPRRRLYRVTALGVRKAMAAIDEIAAPSFGRPAWA